MLSEKLKPCPFCGGNAQVQEFDHGGGAAFAVECDDEECPTYLSGVRAARRCDAIAAWNTRHQAQEEAKAVSVEGVTVSSATAVIGEEQSSIDWGVQPTSAPNQHTRDRIAELEAAFKWAYAKGADSFLQDPEGTREWRLYLGALNTKDKEGAET